MSKDTLHLPLTFEWYDMIESGRKKVDYRDIKDFWTSRLLIEPEDGGPIKPREYKTVVFHRGYTKRQMEWTVDKIDIGKGDARLGADPLYPQYRIHIGIRIK